MSIIYGASVKDVSATPRNPITVIRWRPNVLEREFTVEQPNTAWVGDITYVWTLEGWLYLSVILDLYSRRVVGWAMGKRIDQALTLRALGMAFHACEPGPGLIHHTDRGSQYAANDYQKMLKARGITCSMSRKGNCWDNAVAESFFATLKVEFVHERLFHTRTQATREIFEYIEVFYNDASYCPSRYVLEKSRSRWFADGTAGRFACR